MLRACSVTGVQLFALGAQNPGSCRPLSWLPLYKRTCQEIYERFDACGEPRPDFVPHPDDLELNARTGEVYINGPFDRVEKARWERGKEWIAGREDDLELMAEVAKISDRPDHWSLQIERERDLLERLKIAFPDEATRRVPGFNVTEWRAEEARRRERQAEWRRSRSG